MAEFEAMLGYVDNENFESLDPSILSSLRTRWRTSLLILHPTAYSSVSNWYYANSWFEYLLRMHSGGGGHSGEKRFYHTMNHLQEIFELLDTLLPSSPSSPPPPTCPSKPAAICYMSTFFHDSIYNPKSPTNEEESAQLWKSFCIALKIPWSDDAVKVHGYIIATKIHEVSNEPDPYLKIFIDADMGVLSKSKSAYDNYAGLIREEYKHVERGVYCEKRAEVLTNFLSTPRIYASPEMYVENESIARDNIMREISMLESEVIPRERKVIEEWKVKGALIFMAAAAVGANVLERKKGK